MKVFVGMGSNLGNRESFLRRAVEETAALPGTCVERVSSIYDTDPVGEGSEPPYLNAVALLTTDLPAERLLPRLREVERRLGRPDARRTGPRTIDLDLLYYGSSVIRRPGIEVPHPRCTERLFVLVPMVELEPGWVDPRTGLRMDALLKERKDLGSVRWAGRFQD